MKSVKIEYFCPELCHFYGDHGNLLYLKKKAQLMGNDTEVIETPRGQNPCFASGGTSFLYLGPTTEKHQSVLIDALKKYSDELRNYIENGGFVLATGNSCEVFYESILQTDGSELSGLNFFPIKAQRFSGKRYSVNVIGEYEGQKIAGYKNLLSRTITKENLYPLFRVIKEKGETAPPDAWEGIHYKNLYATYLLGPILLQNPYFSNHLLHQIFGDDYSEQYIPYEREAYEKRIHDVMTDKNPDHNG